MGKLMNMLFGATPVSNLLVDAGIPKPSSLLVGMLVPKIDMLQDARFCDGDWINVEMKLQNSTLEIRLSIGRESWGIESHRTYDVSIGMPGDNDGKGYLSVDLDKKEQQIMISAMMRLHSRIMARRRAKRDAESQEAALDIIEKMI